MIVFTIILIATNKIIFAVNIAGNKFTILLGVPGPFQRSSCIAKCFSSPLVSFSSPLVYSSVIVVSLQKDYSMHQIFEKTQVNKSTINDIIRRHQRSGHSLI